MKNREQIKYAKEVLDFIIDFSDKNYYMPTMKEIANGLGIKSDSTVCYIMKYLEKEGFIKTIPNKARAIIVSKREYDGRKNISKEVN